MALRPWLWGVLIVLLPAAVEATVAIRLSPRELAERSSLAGEGEVVSARSEWTPDGKRIVSRVRLRVEEAWKGEPGEVELVVPGGSVDGLGQIVQGMPVFREGERVVVFAEGPERAAPHRVVGLAQGKFSVVEVPDEGRLLVPRLEGLQLVDPLTGAEVPPLWERPVPVEALRRQAFPEAAR